MPTVRTPAFLTPPASAVVAEAWMLRRGDADESLGDDLPSFDPAATVELGRRLTFDPEAVAAACGLEVPDQIAAAALWASRSTGLKGASAPVRVVGPGPQVADLRLSLSGGDLGGSLVLRTVLMLAEHRGAVKPLVAHVPGSVLWEDEHRHVVTLEGTGGRFPTELRTFGEGNGFPRRAVWFLDWDRDDLSLPVLGSVRLYLNDAHPMVGAIAAGTDDAETARIRETLKFELALELVMGALANREFLDDPAAYEAGTVGAIVRRLCTMVLFPYVSLEELAVRARTPSRLAADLQSALQLFWEPLP